MIVDKYRTEYYISKLALKNDSACIVAIMFCFYTIYWRKRIVISAIFQLSVQKKLLIKQ